MNAPGVPRLKRPRLGGARSSDAASSDASVAASGASATAEEPVLRRPKFGARHLADGDDVFQHNAWDNVEWTDQQERDAQRKVDDNSRVLVSNARREEYDKKAADYWDAFYSNHDNKFFKDRHWLFTEFPELAKLAHVRPDQLRENQTPVTVDDTDPNTNANEGGNVTQCSVSSDVLRRQSISACVNNTGSATAKEVGESGDTEKRAVFEIGCGVGNTVFPIVSANANTNLHVYAADYSAVAIDILKASEQYDPTKCTAFVLDISKDDALENCPIAKGSVDIITLIFVLSAISPDRMEKAIEQVALLLKPGGCVMLRDYGRYDLAQLRFKSGHAIEDNFYARGDGTRVYFFTLDELEDIFKGCGLVAEETRYDRRMIVNRSRKLQMFRIWVQCVYRKKNN